MYTVNCNSNKSSEIISNAWYKESFHLLILGVRQVKQPAEMATKSDAHGN